MKKIITETKVIFVFCTLVLALFFLGKDILATYNEAKALQPSQDFILLNWSYQGFIVRDHIISLTPRDFREHVEFVLSKKSVVEVLFFGFDLLVNLVVRFSIFLVKGVILSLLPASTAFVILTLKHIFRKITQEIQAP